MGGCLLILQRELLDTSSQFMRGKSRQSRQSFVLWEKKVRGDQAWLNALAPTLLIRSPMLRFSNSLAKSPGQYGSTVMPAAFTRVVMLSPCRQASASGQVQW